MHPVSIQSPSTSSVKTGADSIPSSASFALAAFCSSLVDAGIGNIETNLPQLAESMLWSTYPRTAFVVAFIPDYRCMFGAKVGKCEFRPNLEDRRLPTWQFDHAALLTIQLFIGKSRQIGFYHGYDRTVMVSGIPRILHGILIIPINRAYFCYFPAYCLTRPSSASQPLAKVLFSDAVPRYTKCTQDVQFRPASATIADKAA
jgi:hypothetical protein